VVGEPANGSVLKDLRDRMLGRLVETSDVVPPSRDPRMEPELVQEFLKGDGAG